MEGVELVQAKTSEGSERISRMKLKFNTVLPDGVSDEVRTSGCMSTNLCDMENIKDVFFLAAISWEYSCQHFSFIL